MVTRNLIEHESRDPQGLVFSELISKVQALGTDDFGSDEQGEAAFYARALAEVVTGLSAIGGVLWRRDANQAMRPICAESPPQFLTERGDAALKNSQLLLRVVSGGLCLLVPPKKSDDVISSPNPTEQVVVLAPLRECEQVTHVIELFLAPEAVEASQRALLAFVQRLCALLAETLRAGQLRQFQARQALWNELTKFSRAIHASLDAREVATVIANESKRLLTVDRVSVAVKRGRRLLTLAVSGLDTFDARAESIVLLNELIDAAMRTGEAIWYSGESDAIAPQLETAFDRYLEIARSRRMGITPIYKLRDPININDQHSPPELLGALVVEQIEEVAEPPGRRERIEVITEQSAQALANVAEYEQVFLLPVWRTIGKTRLLTQARLLPKTTAIGGGILIALLILLLMPYRFEVYATGVVRPVERREIFAPVEGVVQRLEVRHGDRLEPGALLCELRNPDVEVTWLDLLGQRASTREQLATAGRSLIENPRRLSTEERTKLAGDRVELVQQLKSLDRQLELVAQKRELLKITSPIAGEVTTWDVENLLLHRPVNRGDTLLSLADPSRGWELELRVPEDEIGYVANAQSDQPEQLTVSYRLATDPETSLFGRLIEVHRSAELQKEEGNVVLARVAIDSNELEHPRPGAECRAKIRCGWRPLGFVIFHDAIAFLQSRVLFRL
jgi:hypothetical protein